MSEQPFDSDARSWKSFWDELGVGPLWIRRDVDDPFADEVPGLPEAPPARSAAASPAPQAAPAARRTNPPPRRAQDGLSVGQGVRAGQSPSRPEAVAAPSAGVPAPAPAPAPLGLPAETIAAIAGADWQTLCRLAGECRACPMAATRQHVVFGEGAPGPKLAVVGEAPGGEEDLQGKPFVGKSGRLLTAMLEAVGIKRGDDAVILNTLKCRPPANRDPHPEELAACTHYLRRQLELIAPDVVFVIGRYAARTILNSGETPLGRLRGSVHSAMMGGRQVPVVVSYHPSYLLRSPDAKAKAWEDLVLLRRACRDAGMPFAQRKREVNA